ncbi:MAG TPA: transglutaminase domain-containing protein [Chthonomonadaceae bacterium]|nr:transglutaminase domain-containing protein [Chthonomonadaceae bacterium]
MKPLLAMICFALLWNALPSGADELLANPTFAEGAKGWRLMSASVLPSIQRGASGVVQLEKRRAMGEMGGTVFTDALKAPVEHELRFQASAKGKGQLGINVFAQNGDLELLASGHWDVALTGKDWQPITANLVAPIGTTSYRIVLYNDSDSPILLAEAHLSTGAEKRPDPSTLRSLGGPGVIRAIERAPVKTKPGVTGVVTFPIPGEYRDQVPLAFRVTSNPPGAIRGYTWRKRPDGMNWLCDVSVSTGPKGALVKYEALVLVGNRDPAVLSKTNKPEVPADVEKWTHSTACVQSADPIIRKKAEELAQGTEDIETYARKVMAFTSTNRGTGAPFKALDAKAAMACGGSCTSRANLAAALLRARGIPARTVAHLPLWSGPLYEHWLVEYWHPGVGWVWLESTLGKWQPRPWTVAVLNVAMPEDEDRAFDPLHLRYVMPGAPHSAVIELSDAVWPAEDLVQDDATNIAEPVAPLQGSAEEMTTLFQAARAAFTQLSARCMKGSEPIEHLDHILAGATSGKANDLRAALTP